MFSLFNFSSFFSRGVSWPHLPLCADAHGDWNEKKVEQLDIGEEIFQTASSRQIRTVCDAIKRQPRKFFKKRFLSTSPPSNWFVISCGNVETVDKSPATNCPTSLSIYRQLWRPISDMATNAETVLGFGVELKVVHGSILCDPIQPNPSADCSNPTQPTTGRKIWTQPGPILSVFFALIVHSELKSVHPGFPVAFIFKHKLGLINK